MAAPDGEQLSSDPSPVSLGTPPRHVPGADALRWGKRLVLLGLFGLALLAGCSAGAPEPEGEPGPTTVCANPVPPPGAPPPEPAGLRLRTGRGEFDPLVDGVVLQAPEPLLRTADASVQTYYIVQFHPGTEDSFRRDATAAGAELLSPFRDSAFLVRLQPQKLEAVCRMPSVRWVGPHLPAAKVDYRLDRFVQKDEEVELMVTLYSGEFPRRPAATIEDENG